MVVRENCNEDEKEMRPNYAEKKENCCFTSQEEVHFTQVSSERPGMELGPFHAVVKEKAAALL